MIRGALVLATGLVLGYAKAVSETEAVNQVVNDVVEKVKKTWDEASAARDEQDDLTPEGVDFLMNRLRDALPHAHVSDETLIIRGGADEALLTMGDLRAPFSLPPTTKTTTNRSTQGENPQ